MIKLESYKNIVGEDVIFFLKQLVDLLKGKRVVHVNSTKVGGGVAEILHRLVPLMQELGLDAQWFVIKGNDDFFKFTKSMHNALQGSPVHIPQQLFKNYEEINAENATLLKNELNDADIVFIHDPQPASIINHFPKRKGKWVWRCHIDISKPVREVWKYLRQYVIKYDASIFSTVNFSQPLPHPMYIIPPSIDPLSEKNKELDERFISDTYRGFDVNVNSPVILQVSRFDKFKDPVGVIRAYKLVKKSIPSLQLILAGGLADDDPEGKIVYEEVKNVIGDDKDVHALLLPSDANITINALQRGADIVLQKSIKEGFGLTVTEAMWKAKPVIGGNVGGIKIQITDYYTGFLVNTPEGAALRIRYLLYHKKKRQEMGEKAREFVRRNFLITRHLRDYLTLMISLIYSAKDRIEL